MISAAFGPCSAIAAKLAGAVAHLELQRLVPGVALGLDPHPVDLEPRGVDDEQVARVAEPVGVQVVDHAAVVLAEQRVLALAGFKLGQVVGQDLV